MNTGVTFTELIENNITVYSVGLVCASVCADNSCTIEEITAYINDKNPTGLNHGWALSEDTHFKGGNKNPCPCDKYPHTRKHYLFNC